MKAYRKSGSVIAIRRHPHNAEEIEEIILEMRHLLQEFRSCCENRNTEAFPCDVVKRLVSCCELLRERVMDIDVDEEYFSTVSRTHSVEGYFEEKFAELGEAEKAWRVKREVFNTFYEMLLDLKKTHFMD